MLEKNRYPHRHTGTDELQIDVKDLIVNRSQLTASSSLTVVTLADAIVVINNLRTRLNELETCLKNNNILR